MTAQKSAQAIEQVPISVTAIGAEALEQIGADELADLAPYLPNLRIEGDDISAYNVYIRGFGTNTFNSSLENSVGLVVDDLPFGRAAYLAEALFDVERIEVLRGPQGALFGKNTVAGLISVTSREPRERWGFEAGYRGGADGLRRLEGAADVPFGEWGAARLSGVDLSSDGALHNQYLNRREDQTRAHGERLKIVLLPSAALKAQLTLLHARTAIAALPFQLMKLDGDTGDYLRTFDPAIEDDPRNFVTSFDTAGSLERDATTGGLRTDWDPSDTPFLSDLRVTAVIGASTYELERLHEVDFSPADLARFATQARHRQTSGELRVTGFWDALARPAPFIVGVAWLGAEFALQSRILAGQDIESFATSCDFRQLATGDLNACAGGTPVTPPVPPSGAVGEDYYQLDYDVDSRATAVFGQVTWPLGERWSVTPGVRLNQETKRADVAGTPVCAGRDVGRPCVVEQILDAEPYALRDQRRTERDVSPRLALQYEIDASSVYLSWARGYKGGGFNLATFDGQNVEFQPERARTLEAGAKGTVLDGTLRYAIAAFDTRFDDLQVFTISGTVTNLTNAGRARSRGGEIELTWRTPLNWLSVAGAGGLLEAKYIDYPGAPAPIDAGIGATQNLAGQRIAFAPRSTLALMPIATVPIGSLSLQAGVDALYQGDQYTDTDLDPHTYVPGHWQYGARFVLGDDGRKWSLSLGGSNLTDERVFNQVTDAILFPRTYVVQQANGRKVFGALSLHW